MKIRTVNFLKGATAQEHWPPPTHPEVAFVGRSNVGKSSMLNVLVQRKSLVRVSNTPGRTREINFFALHDTLDNTLHLVDLPGYGYAKVPEDMRRHWGPMIESYLRNRETLAAVVMILDIRRDPGDEERMLLDFFEAMLRPVILVTTKCDKFSRSVVLQHQRKIAQTLGVELRDLLPFSSLNKQGGDAVWKRIEACLPPSFSPDSAQTTAEEADEKTKS
jgi:GTP-binding protein